jgi:hypothetical protein
MTSRENGGATNNIINAFDSIAERAGGRSGQSLISSLGDNDRRREAKQNTAASRRQILRV